MILSRTTRPQHRLRNGGGFSLVEIVIASAISAMVIGASVAMIGAIATNQQGVAKIGKITIGETAVQEIGLWDGTAVPEGVDSPGIRGLPFAPSFGLTWEFEQLRTEFHEDLAHATAVFCLPRTTNSAYRELQIPVPSQIDARSFAEPGSFAAHLNGAIDQREADGEISSAQAAKMKFPTIEPVPLRSAKNVSIFMFSTQGISPASEAEHLRAFAIYELDFIDSATLAATNSGNTAGTYMCLKRWVETGNQLEISPAAIELFYPEGPGAQEFAPAFVEFTRRDRRGTDLGNQTVEAGNSVDRDIFKVAENKPFYFVWWPDPADPHLIPLPGSIVGTYGDTDPRKQYAGMMGRTPHFLVVPKFPAL